MKTTQRRHPVITRWSAMTPYGMGREAFADGVAGRRESVGVIDTERWRGPSRRAGLVPGFEVRDVLGKKGTRSMDRVTGLAVATVGDLLERDKEGDRVVAGAGTALVLGTTTGSAQSMMDFTRTSLTGEKPYHVDPALMPNAVMNCAAGQCAIWYQLKGPNTTLAGGRVAGLLALKYAGRLIASNRATTVLCGAAEEFSDSRAWLDWHARPADAGTELGEGCGMLLLESAPETRDPVRGQGEVLAVESRVCLAGDFAGALAGCLQDACDEAGVRAEDIWAISTSGVGGAIEAQEKGFLHATFGPQTLSRIPDLSLIGDTGAASGALQVAALLSLGERDADSAGRVVAVSSVDRNGAVAVALLRLLGA
ncbi:beta-ketoacyl synthase N-terminal-like domain-containing protein [Micromonospora sp. NPDC005220]|uniref:beta-ketoacyl synthase N-terminal-like domain-containing protein n=1 Tax=Micromonospora sp. NPDC005220 TaxID=3155589 RepID=UPI0033B9A275